MAVVRELLDGVLDLVAIEKARGRGMIPGKATETRVRKGVVRDALSMRARHLKRQIESTYGGDVSRRGVKALFANTKRRVKLRGKEVGNKRLLAKLPRISKSAPKTLFVARPVTNAQEIADWAASQGFKSVASDMHVTIAHSTRPVNWAELGDDWRLEPSEERARAQSCGPVGWAGGYGNTARTIAGGPREVKQLGDDGAVVLCFQSVTLSERWASILRAGASWDFPAYQPHITISYDASGVDLAKVTPYSGEIILGPEDWSEVKADAAAAAKKAEVKISKSVRDLIERVAKLEAAERAA